MKIKKCDVLIAGVGGQGIILCSDILGAACIIEDIPIRGAEVHGMSQRGGSVEAHVRIGCLYGPRIPDGSADVLIATEPLEGARFLHYLKNGGTAIVNTRKIPLLGQDYDTERMVEIIRSRTSCVTARDFTSEAIKAGSIRTLNILMLGAASKTLPLKRESIIAAIEANVRKEFIGINLAAFSRGQEV